MVLLRGIGYRAVLEDASTPSIGKRRRLYGAATRAPANLRDHPDLLPHTQRLVLYTGSTIPLEFSVPRNLRAAIPTLGNGTRVDLYGYDWRALTTYAHTLKQAKKPEPYKGKGIYVGAEPVKLKSKRK